VRPFDHGRRAGCAVPPERTPCAALDSTAIERGLCRSALQIRVPLRFISHHVSSLVSSGFSRRPLGCVHAMISTVGAVPSASSARRARRCTRPRPRFGAPPRMRFCRRRSSTGPAGGSVPTSHRPIVFLKVLPRANIPLLPILLTLIIMVGTVGLMGQRLEYQ
jgi:hypothetical protein